ncbi:hypothetical protein QX776_04780 [Alteromonadaceae bacterium BrNp21-10]|nr:hypothetical protein [Alteromonadaceae bacterium BrNp21-10]
MHSIIEAQQDMRQAYFDGVPGVISSGSAWIVAGIVALLLTPVSGMLTLIFGGMLIFPVSVVICKMMGRSGKHQKDNPLASLAIEGTFWMLLSIPVAVGAAMYKIELFFPAMLMVIAGRYLTFNTLYGSKVYWVFSVFLALSAVALVFLNAPTYAGGLAGGVMELVFALVIYLRAIKSIK